jgi:hypothetical protein
MYHSAATSAMPMENDTPAMKQTTVSVTACGLLPLDTDEAMMMSFG